jgi:hypothetical protein
MQAAGHTRAEAAAGGVLGILGVAVRAGTESGYGWDRSSAHTGPGVARCSHAAAAAAGRSRGVGLGMRPVRESLLFEIHYAPEL